MTLIEKIEKFEDLYHRRYRYVYGYCKRNVNIRSEDPEDMAQEIFKNVFENMDKFRNESSLDTWLYTVTRNFCLSRYRWKSANKRRGEIVDVSKALFLTDKTPSALEQAISQQILEEINKYLVKMPLHYQEVLLEFMRSNQRQQSAAILGISRKTFTCRLNRARTMLRKHMEKKGLI